MQILRVSLCRDIREYRVGGSPLSLKVTMFSFYDDGLHVYTAYTSDFSDNSDPSDCSDPHPL